MGGESLLVRPKARGLWGEASNREFGIHLLSSFPGISAVIAGRVFDYFGGVPLKWSVEMEEMLMVEGVGVERVRRMWKGLER